MRYRMRRNTVEIEWKMNPDYYLNRPWDTPMDFAQDRRDWKAGDMVLTTIRVWLWGFPASQAWNIRQLMRYPAFLRLKWGCVRSNTMYRFQPYRRGSQKWKWHRWTKYFGLDSPVMIDWTPKTRSYPRFQPCPTQATNDDCLRQVNSCLNLEITAIVGMLQIFNASQNPTIHTIRREFWSNCKTTYFLQKADLR